MPITGMFVGNRGAETCFERRRPARIEDWTCPHCGLILDPYLFSAITQKSVPGKDKDAFWAGYEGCIEQGRVGGSTQKPVAIGTTRCQILPKANHAQFEAKIGSNAEGPSLLRFVPAVQ
jgi:hypothetical protein